MICLDGKSRISTMHGERSASTLAVGDEVYTHDNGAEKITWVGRVDLSLAKGTLDHRMQPILIRKGALGYGLPDRDLLVSPQHRIMLTEKTARRLFSADEVLVAARNLVGLPGVEHWVASEVRYVQIMCEASEIALCNGVWCELFQPSDRNHGAACAHQREEISRVFPDFVQTPENEPLKAARSRMDRYEAELLIAV